MSIFYQYLSALWLPQGALGWTDKVYSLLPARQELIELAVCCIRTRDLVYNSLFFAVHEESMWWIQTGVTEYNESGRYALPKVDWLSLCSWIEWQTYWNDLKERVLPSVLQYQASLSLMYLFQGILSVFVSQETLYRLTQHPHRRAIAVASRDSDLISVGMELWAVSLWANLLFFAANYTVDQLLLIYDHHCNRLSLRNHDLPINKQASMAVLVSSSWNLLYTQCRRYYYSSLGGGLGSVVCPGWGTLLGIGLGDGWALGWAALQPDPTSPATFFPLFRNLKDLPTATCTDDVPSSPSSMTHEELMCGCCQIASFSSDPKSHDRVPISSRACSHTICKSCVQKCHLAFMERTCNYEEWIKCPLCNAQRAFSAHDHLVNRSLCAAIALIETREHSS